MPRARRICVELLCGKPATKGNRCDGCAQKREVARGSRHERGYGVDHDAVRRALKKQFGRDYQAGKKPTCWRCGERLHPWQELDADHSGLSAAEGGQADCLAHASCNRGKRLPSPLQAGPQPS